MKTHELVTKDTHTFAWIQCEKSSLEVKYLWKNLIEEHKCYYSIPGIIFSGCDGPEENYYTRNYQEAVSTLAGIMFNCLGVCGNILSVL